LAGVVGAPRDTLSLLASQSYTFDLTFGADGYLPVPVAVTIPQDPTFPLTFTPIHLGDLLMHREPVVLRGRTVLNSGGIATPVGGATVAITGLWSTAPPANVIVPPGPPNVVSLSPPLYFARTTAAGTLRRHELVPVAGADKSLLTYGLPGASALRLSDRVGLSVGDIAVVDESDLERTEYLPITAISGLTTPDQPATITLAHPLAHRHRVGATVRKVTPQPPGPTTACTREAIAGDTCFFVASVAGLNTVHVVEIAGGPAPAEYHGLRTFSVTSDTQGYFRLPPLSRVAQVEIQATDGVHTPVTRTFSPDYAETENRIDFVFT
jgi:hypothetical protein